MTEQTKRRAELLATAVLVVCALVLTGLVLKREFTPTATASRTPDSPVRQTTMVMKGLVRDWREVAEHGQRSGSPNAAVTVIEFSDYECPYCRQMKPVLDSLRLAYGDRVQFVIRHLPLSSIHPKAWKHAIAAECAALQGVFEPYHAALLGGNFGGSYIDLFRKVGGQDTGAFESCLIEEQTAPRIQEDLAAAAELGIDATPTFIINDVLVRGAGSFQFFEGLILDALEVAK